MSIIIGSHVGFNKDKQMLGSVIESLSYGANTFMFYTGAPQNTNRKEIDANLTLLAHNLMEKENININDVIVHAPYIINLANDKNMDFNVEFLTQEIDRVQSLGVNKLVLHPGSHVGLGEEAGLNNIVEALNKVLKEEMNITICLETMAGKGSELGKKFEELKYIIDNVKLNNKLGVCLDTCHINDSGYDITNFDKILDEFDNIIGLDRLKVVHVNDSKNEKDSHKDRHENFGLGHIGFDNLINVIYNDRLKGIPMILETPYVDIDGKKYAPYKQEIKMIKEKTFNENLLKSIEDDNI